jgi:hypothetical protein
MSDNTFVPTQRHAIPNRSPRSSRKRLYTMGAGEGPAPLLSRAIQFRVPKDLQSPFLCLAANGTEK